MITPVLRGVWSSERKAATVRPPSPRHTTSASPSGSAPSTFCSTIIRHLALSPVGAWLEVFRTTRIVAREDVRRRRLLVTRPPEHEPYGWRWPADVRRLDRATTLLSAVEEYGYRVLEPPFDVVTEARDG